MKINKLYTLTIYTANINSAFTKNVLVDQDAITFEDITKSYHAGNNEPYKYIGALYSDAVRHSPTFIVKAFDKNNLQDASFWRSPKLALPQNKMQLLKDKYNVKIVRDPEKADYIIVSDKYFQSLTDYTWHNYYQGPFIKDKYLSQIKGHVSEFIHDEIVKFVDYVISQDGYIRVDNRLPYNSNYKGYFNLKDQYEDRFSFYLINDLDALNFILKNPNKLVKDDDLINYCNEDSIILNPEECKSISQMIKSGDRDTISLALEMMANCNIEKSFDKLALIFAFHKDLLGNGKNWNSVNVKSLRKQLEDIPSIEGYNGYGFNQLVKVLHAKGALTTFAVGAISNKMCKTVLHHVGLTSADSVFDVKPKDLKLKSAYSPDLPF